MSNSELEGGRSRRRIPTGLAVAMGLAVLGRIGFLNSQSLTMDEVTELGIASGTVDQIVRTVDGFPPLYHLLLHGWLNLFGSDGAGRWLSVLFGVLTVLCVWKLARILVGPRGADWAAGLISILPFHIWYSQELRAYSLVILLAALSLWLFFRARATNRWIDWASFVGAGVAGMYSHYFFAALLSALALCHLFERPAVNSPRRGWVSLAALAVLCIPEILFLSIDLTFEVNPRFGKPTFGPAELAYTYFSLVSGYTIGPSMRELHTIGVADALRGFAPWLAVVAVAAGYPAWSVVRAPQSGMAFRSLLILCLVPVVLVGGLTLVGHVGYNVRYSSWVVVPIVVWIGAGLAQTIGRREGKAALALLVVIFVVARWNRVFVDRYREEDNRGLAAFLQEQGLESRQALVTAGYMVLPVSYYLGNDWSVERVPHVSPSGSDLDEAMIVLLTAPPAQRQVWLVYTRPFHGDPAGLLLDRVLPAVIQTDSFAGIDLYLIDLDQL